LIVEAALVLLDGEGLDALTMPRLADHLGVGTMSLYRHIEGKDDLLDAVAAHVVSGVAVAAGAPDDWEGRVVGYLRSLRDQALRHGVGTSASADQFEYGLEHLVSSLRRHAKPSKGKASAARQSRP